MVITSIDLSTCYIIQCHRAITEDYILYLFSPIGFNS